jgi:hypothetical protein
MTGKKGKGRGDKTLPDEEPGPPKVRSTEILAVGLYIAGFKSQRLAKRTQIKRFKTMYGTYPIVVEQLWEQLQANQLDKKLKLDYVFWALFFLKKYPRQDELETKMNKDAVTLRKWIWTIIYGLQDLKAEYIRFPNYGGLPNTLTFIVSVDGTDCPIQEPRPFNNAWFSQKFKGPGVKYEIAVDVLTGDCVWISGPFMASKSDIKIFREDGLMALIPEGRLVIADKGYRGEPGVVSYPNHLDDEDVRDFKKRVRARHETFNGRLKTFDVLKQVFRHKPVLHQHKACLEAIAVITQCEINLGFKLFSI